MSGVITFQEFKQAELKYKNKIIELQKELDFETLRANEYQNKFKESVLNNSSKQGQNQRNILDQLTQKQKEVNDLMQELLETRKELQFVSENGGGVNGGKQDLMKQNEELRGIIQELKDAAIAAIMQKDREIEQLNNKLYEIDFSAEIDKLNEKNDKLKQQMDQKKRDYEEQIKNLNEKLLNERQLFSIKLEQLHKSIFHEENMKLQLLEKTQSLQGDLQTLEKVIQKYQSKIAELQSHHSSSLITLNKQLHESSNKIQQLNTEIKAKQKIQRDFLKSIIVLEKEKEDYQKQIEALNEEKEELDRKLKIKNKKAQMKANTSSVFSSFEELSQKANLYSSFAERRETGHHVKESFIGKPSDLSEIKEIQIEEIQNWNDYLASENIDMGRKQGRGVCEIENIPQTTKQPEKKQQTSTKETETGELKPNSKISDQKIAELESKIKKYLNQITVLSEKNAELTKQLQKERNSKQKLKEDLSKEISGYKVQKQELQVHIYKLENHLLVQKLQNAQKMDTNNEIREEQKKKYQTEIRKLKAALESPKKKKGFFN